MGFWRKFIHPKTEEDEYEPDEMGYLQKNREELDMRDPLVREQFAQNCLERMREASNEIDRLSQEYDTVTSYLTDMEEVDALPKEERKLLSDYASQMKLLRSKHDEYVLKEGTITEAEFKRIQMLEDQVVEGIKSLSEQEDYRKKVKQDLSRIDRERSAYSFRQHELSSALENMRGIAFISMAATVILILVLLAINLLLHFDVVVGYYITIAVVAIALTVIYVKYSEYRVEKRKVDGTINELILLENKVKIRYVNNKNLLDYLYTKYDVESAGELKDMYSRYIKEYEDRRNFENNEYEYNEMSAKFIKLLRNSRVKDPDVWLHQLDAVLDSREMVEIRHGLIGRRQKLRKQLEYNENVAMEASDSIKKLIHDYPSGAAAIMQMVDAYENK